jgi:LmbE family N-acetylglucosaminyl deacetylase
MAVLAHPDDESLGVGPTLARCAAEGVSVHLVTATRGEKGRHFTNEDRPDDAEVGRVRERELRCAAGELGIRDVALLDYIDGELDSADPVGAISAIASHLRRVRPQVVLTFDPFGAYGHPDHIAISQFTTAATVAAAAPGVGGPPHQVSKLYYFVTDRARWNAYQAAFKRLISRVDGVEREAVEWPDWNVSARIDTRDHWRPAWSAVRCHASQIAVYQGLEELGREEHEALWGTQTFYRAFSLVNGGRDRETDLFTGIG